MNPTTVLVGIWMLVIGYGLFYVGFKNWGGQKVSFQQAFFPSGLFNLGSGSSSGDNTEAQGTHRIAPNFQTPDVGAIADAARAAAQKAFGGGR